MKKRIIILGIVILVSIIIIYLYGIFISPKKIKTNEYKITSSIGKTFDGLKIVHISDLHYNKYLTDKLLKKVIDEINLIRPDILVITGDLFDNKVSYSEDDINTLYNYLKEIKTTYGKYIIKGDNDKSFEGDLIDISDTYKLIFDNDNIPIIIKGISSSGSSVEAYEKEKSIETPEIKTCYSILLIHEPDYIENIDKDKYDLILAGHGMGGIKLPIIGRIALEEGAKKYSYGYYKLGNTILYVSNGLGGSNIKYRSLNEPSINFYRIANENEI